MADRSIVVRLRAVVGEYKSGMAEAAKATESVSSAGERVSKSASTASRAMQAAFTGAAVAGLVGFAKKSIDAFSNLEDATAAAGVVFGTSMSKITTQAADAARTIGMSKSQVIDAANMFGTFGKSAGLAGDDLAQFSTDMTKLAGDMASFRGTSPEQAIQAIGAAMRGEMEPIRTYGVLIDDASLKQQALKMGLIETTKDALQPQAKVLAAQALILQQTTLAQGDFARTSDSTKNVQTTLKASVENLSATLGGALAPSVTAASRGLQGMVDAIEANSAVIPPLVTLVGGLVVAAGGALVVAKVGEAVVGMAGAMRGAMAAVQSFGLQLYLMGKQAESAKLASLGTAVVGFGRALPALTIAVAAATTAWVLWSAKQEEARQRVESLTDAIRADSGAIGENTREWAANRLQKSGAAEAARAIGVDLRTLTDASLGSADALALVRSQIDPLIASAPTGGFVSQLSSDQLSAATAAMKLNDFLVQQGVDLDKAKAAAQQYGQMMQASTGPAKSYADANKKAAERIAELAKAADEAVKSIDKQRDALYGAANAALAASGDELGYQRSLLQAQESLSEARKTDTRLLDENGNAWAKNKAKGIEFRGELDNQAKSLQETIRAQVAMGRSADELAGKMEEGRKAWIANAVAGGMLPAVAERIADSFGLIPSKVRTDVELRGEQEAIAKAQALQAELARIERQVNVFVKTTYGSSGTPPGVGPKIATPFASGGLVTGPGGPRSDSIPAYLSNGEFVVNAASTAKHRRTLDWINADRYADGGQVAWTGVRPGPTVNLTAPALDSAALSAAVAVALDGTRLDLGTVDPITHHVSARLLTTISRGV